MWKPKKILNYVFIGLAILYGTILMFPQVLFSNSLTHKNFKVYYHSEQSDIDQLPPILDKSLTLLSSSDVFDPKRTQKIFLCNNYGEFTFFAPRSRKSFGVNYPVTQNMFLTLSNIGKDEIKRNGAAYKIRSLSGVIAHETTHSGLENKLGLFRYKMLPTWKNEGYCDYIAKESSYDEKLGWTQICGNNEKTDLPSFTYFKYKTYVSYLLKKEKVALDSFLIKDFDMKRVALKSRKTFCPSISE